MERIQDEIAKATLMVVVGTSGSVYPAANFVHWARQGGARTVYIGPEQPLNAHAFTNVVLGKDGTVWWEGGEGEPLQLIELYRWTLGSRSIRKISSISQRCCGRRASRSEHRRVARTKTNPRPVDV